MGNTPKFATKLTFRRKRCEDITSENSYLTKMLPKNKEILTVTASGEEEKVSSGEGQNSKYYLA